MLVHKHNMQLSDVFVSLYFCCLERCVWLLLYESYNYILDNVPKTNSPSCIFKNG